MKNGYKRAKVWGWLVAPMALILPVMAHGDQRGHAATEEGSQPEIVLAQAAAPLRRQIVAEGGIRELPVSGNDMVLKPAEIASLIEFSRELPTRFPAIVDAAGQAAPADVEFGFQQGALRLFQIRPFLDNARTRGLGYLQALDANRAAASAVAVDLNAVP